MLSCATFTTRKCYHLSRFMNPRFFAMCCPNYNTNKNVLFWVIFDTFGAFLRHPPFRIVSRDVVLKEPGNIDCPFRVHCYTLQKFLQQRCCQRLNVAMAAQSSGLSCQRIGRFLLRGQLILALHQKGDLQFCAFLFLLLLVLCPKIAFLVKLTVDIGLVVMYCGGSGFLQSFPFGLQLTFNGKPLRLNTLLSRLGIENFCVSYRTFVPNCV